MKKDIRSRRAVIRHERQRAKRLIQEAMIQHESEIREDYRLFAMMEAELAEESTDTDEGSDYLTLANCDEGESDFAELSLKRFLEERTLFYDHAILTGEEMQ